MAKISTKEKVLNLLDTTRGVYYSGQELAAKLGVSRTAIWKAINSLREEGYSIEGSTKLGYALAKETDVLSADTIRTLLNEEALAFYDVNCTALIDSTNAYLRTQGLDNACEGTCMIAEEQTAGRGRKGRSFYSPNSTGLYLSVLLRPKLSVEDSVLITTAAAVAAVKACEATNDSLNEGDVKIKWVNDLFVRSKKFCGILTEANFSMETHGFDFAVLGIGFNLAPPVGGWPEEIKNIAGSLFEEKSAPGSRNKLAANFLNEFLPIYKNLPNVTYLEEYRKRSLAIGKTVKVLEPDGSFKMANVKGIDDRCQLIVVFEGEKEEKILNSGEISIKLS